MKKICLLALIPIAFLCLGFSNRLVSIAPGVYPVKAKSLTFFDLVTKEVDLGGNPAELTESKPEDLRVDPEIQIENPKYGSFLFGNNKHRVWFVMGQDLTGYWSEFYIDQNLDNQITVKEKVKGFESSDSKYRGYKNRQAFGLIPVSIRVSYQGAAAELAEKLFFFFAVNEIGNGSATENDLIVEAFDASFMEGTLTLDNVKDSRPIGFRVIDANSNGCFNDFGKDLMFLDMNRDGFYKKNESFKLIEFLDKKSSGKKAQFHLIIRPYPAKIAVLKALEEYDPAALEPIPDNHQDPEVKAGSVARKKLPAAPSLADDN